MENLSAFIMEFTKLHNASKSERDEARAKHKELVTCDQPPFCKGGEHCGRDKSGLWHCACLSQNKSER